MTKLIRVVIPAFAVLVSVSPGGAQPTPAPEATAPAVPPITKLSLDEAVTIALRLNPTLRAKQSELESTRAGEITAALRPNPNASYAAEQFAGGSDTTPQHTVVVSQTIETGGKRKRRIESARAATAVTDRELADVRRQVVAQVKKSFNDVLVAQRSVALAEQNLTTLDEVERIQRIRADKGDISELELLRIQVQRFQFERDLADARQAAQAARIALRAAAGLDRIAPDFDAVGDLDYRDVAVDVPTIHRLTIQNRPDVRAADAARERAAADYRLARANAWWDVTPQLEYQRIGPDNTIGFGFSLPIRIFDRNQGEIARTMADARRAEEQRQATTVQALSEVDTAASTVETSATKVKLLRDRYLPTAQRVRETVEFAYRRGGLSLLDFLDAERSYRESALEYFRSLGDYWTAVYQLESAVGGSLEH